MQGRQIFDEIKAKQRQVDELKAGMSAVKGAGTQYAAYQVLEREHRKAETELRVLLETDYELAPRNAPVAGDSIGIDFG